MGNLGFPWSLKRWICSEKSDLGIHANNSIWSMQGGILPLIFDQGHISCAVCGAFGSANPFSKSPINRKKCKVTPGRLVCEFTAVDDSSLLIELFLHVVHNIFNWIQSQAV